MASCHLMARALEGCEWNKQTHSLSNKLKERRCDLRRPGTLFIFCLRGHTDCHGTRFSTTPAPHLSRRLFMRLSHPAENETIYLPDGSLPDFLFMTAQ